MYKFICANITKSRNFTSSYKKLAQNKKYHLDGSSVQTVPDKESFEEKWEENQEQIEEVIRVKPNTASRPATSGISSGHFQLTPTIRTIKGAASLPSLKTKNNSKFSAGNFLAVETPTPSISKKYYHVYNITPAATALKRYGSSSNLRKLNDKANEYYRKALDDVNTIQRRKPTFQWKVDRKKPVFIPTEMWMKKYKKKSRTEITYPTHTIKHNLMLSPRFKIREGSAEKKMTEFEKNMKERKLDQSNFFTNFRSKRITYPTLVENFKKKGKITDKTTTGQGKFQQEEKDEDEPVVKVVKEVSQASLRLKYFLDKTKAKEPEQPTPVHTIEDDFETFIKSHPTIENASKEVKMRLKNRFIQILLKSSHDPERQQKKKDTKESVSEEVHKSQPDTEEKLGENVENRQEEIVEAANAQVEEDTEQIVLHPTTVTSQKMLKEDYQVRYPKRVWLDTTNVFDIDKVCMKEAARKNEIGYALPDAIQPKLNYKNLEKEAEQLSSFVNLQSLKQKSDDSPKRPKHSAVSSDSTETKLEQLKSKRHQILQKSKDSPKKPKNSNVPSDMQLEQLKNDRHKLLQEIQNMSRMRAEEARLKEEKEWLDLMPEAKDSVEAAEAIAKKQQAERLRQIMAKQFVNDEADIPANQHGRNSNILVNYKRQREERRMSMMQKTKQTQEALLKVDALNETARSADMSYSSKDISRVPKCTVPKVEGVNENDETGTINRKAEKIVSPKRKPQLNWSSLNSITNKVALGKEIVERIKSKPALLVEEQDRSIPTNAVKATSQNLPGDRAARGYEPSSTDPLHDTKTTLEESDKNEVPKEYAKLEVHVSLHEKVEAEVKKQAEEHNVEQDTTNEMDAILNDSDGAKLEHAVYLEKRNDPIEENSPPQGSFNNLKKVEKPAVEIDSPHEESFDEINETEKLNEIARKAKEKAIKKKLKREQRKLYEDVLRKQNSLSSLKSYDLQPRMDKVMDLVKEKIEIGERSIEKINQIATEIPKQASTKVAKGRQKMLKPRKSSTNNNDWNTTDEYDKINQIAERLASKKKKKEKKNAIKKNPPKNKPPIELSNNSKSNQSELSKNVSGANDELRNNAIKKGENDRLCEESEETTLNPETTKKDNIELLPKVTTLQNGATFKDVEVFSNDKTCTRLKTPDNMNNFKKHGIAEEVKQAQNLKHAVETVKCLNVDSPSTQTSLPVVYGMDTSCEQVYEDHDAVNNFKSKILNEFFDKKTLPGSHQLIYFPKQSLVVSDIAEIRDEAVIRPGDEVVIFENKHIGATTRLDSQNDVPTTSSHLNNNISSPKFTENPIEYSPEHTKDTHWKVKLMEITPELKADCSQTIDHALDDVGKLDEMIEKIKDLENMLLLQREDKVSETRLDNKPRVPPMPKTPPGNQKRINKKEKPKGPKDMILPPKVRSSHAPLPEGIPAGHPEEEHVGPGKQAVKSGNGQLTDDHYSKRLRFEGKRAVPDRKKSEIILQPKSTDKNSQGTTDLEKAISDFIREEKLDELPVKKDVVKTDVTKNVPGEKVIQQDQKKDNNFKKASSVVAVVMDVFQKRFSNENLALQQGVHKLRSTVALKSSLQKSIGIEEILPAQPKRSASGMLENCFPPPENKRKSTAQSVSYAKKIIRVPMTKNLSDKMATVVKAASKNTVRTIKSVKELDEKRIGSPIKTRSNIIVKAMPSRTGSCPSETGKLKRLSKIGEMLTKGKTSTRASTCPPKTSKVALQEQKTNDFNGLASSLSQRALANKNNNSSRHVTKNAVSKGSVTPVKAAPLRPVSCPPGCVKHQKLCKIEEDSILVQEKTARAASCPPNSYKLGPPEQNIKDSGCLVQSLSQQGLSKRNTKSGTTVAKNPKGLAEPKTKNSDWLVKSLSQQALAQTNSKSRSSVTKKTALKESVTSVKTVPSRPVSCPPGAVKYQKLSKSEEGSTLVKDKISRAASCPPKSSKLGRNVVVNAMPPKPIVYSSSFAKIKKANTGEKVKSAVNKMESPADSYPLKSSKVGVQNSKTNNYSWSAQTLPQAAVRSSSGSIDSSQKIKEQKTKYSSWSSQAIPPITKTRSLADVYFVNKLAGAPGNKSFTRTFSEKAPTKSKSVSTPPSIDFDSPGTSGGDRGSKKYKQIMDPLSQQGTMKSKEMSCSDKNLKQDTPLGVLHVILPKPQEHRTADSYLDALKDDKNPTVRVRVTGLSCESQILYGTHSKTLGLNVDHEIRRKCNSAAGISTTPTCQRVEDNSDKNQPESDARTKQNDKKAPGKEAKDIKAIFRIQSDGEVFIIKKADENFGEPKKREPNYISKTEKADFMDPNRHEVEGTRTKLNVNDGNKSSAMETKDEFKHFHEKKDAEEKLVAKIEQVLRKPLNEKEGTTTKHPKIKLPKYHDTKDKPSSFAFRENSIPQRGTVAQIVTIYDNKTSSKLRENLLLAKFSRVLAKDVQAQKGDSIFAGLDTDTFQGIKDDFFRNGLKHTKSNTDNTKTTRVFKKNQSEASLSGQEIEEIANKILKKTKERSKSSSDFQKVTSKREVKSSLQTETEDVVKQILEEKFLKHKSPDFETGHNAAWKLTFEEKNERADLSNIKPNIRPTTSAKASEINHSKCSSPDLQEIDRKVMKKSFDFVKKSKDITSKDQERTKSNIPKVLKKKVFKNDTPKNLITDFSQVDANIYVNKNSKLGASNLIKEHLPEKNDIDIAEIPKNANKPESRISSKIGHKDDVSSSKSFETNKSFNIVTNKSKETISDKDNEKIKLSDNLSQLTPTLHDSGKPNVEIGKRPGNQTNKDDKTAKSKHVQFADQIVCKKENKNLAEQHKPPAEFIKVDNVYIRKDTSNLSNNGPKILKSQSQDILKPIAEVPNAKQTNQEKLMSLKVYKSRKNKPSSSKLHSKEIMEKTADNLTASDIKQNKPALSSKNYIYSLDIPKVENKVANEKNEETKDRSLKSSSMYTLNVSTVSTKSNKAQGDPEKKLTPGKTESQPCVADITLKSKNPKNANLMVSFEPKVYRNSIDKSLRYKCSDENTGFQVEKVFGEKQNLYKSIKFKTKPKTVTGSKYASQTEDVNIKKEQSFTTGPTKETETQDLPEEKIDIKAAALNNKLEKCIITDETPNLENRLVIKYKDGSQIPAKTGDKTEPQAKRDPLENMDIPKNKKVVSNLKEINETLKKIIISKIEEITEPKDNIKKTSMSQGENHADKKALNKNNISENGPDNKDEAELKTGAADQDKLKDDFKTPIRAKTVEENIKNAAGYLVKCGIMGEKCLESQKKLVDQEANNPNKEQGLNITQGKRQDDLEARAQTTNVTKVEKTEPMQKKGMASQSDNSKNDDGVGSEGPPKLRAIRSSYLSELERATQKKRRENIEKSMNRSRIEAQSQRTGEREKKDVIDEMNTAAKHIVKQKEQRDWDELFRSGKRQKLYEQDAKVSQPSSGTAQFGFKIKPTKTPDQKRDTHSTNASPTTNEVSSNPTKAPFTTTKVSSNPTKTPSTPTKVSSTTTAAPSTITKASSSTNKSLSTTTKASATITKPSSTTPKASSTTTKASSTTTKASSTITKPSSTTPKASSTTTKASSTTTKPSSTTTKNSSTTSKTLSTTTKVSPLTPKTSSSKQMTKVEFLKSKEITNIFNKEVPNKENNVKPIKGKEQLASLNETKILDSAQNVNINAEQERVEQALSKTDMRTTENARLSDEIITQKIHKMAKRIAEDITNNKIKNKFLDNNLDEVNVGNIMFVKSKVLLRKDSVKEKKEVSNLEPPMFDKVMEGSQAAGKSIENMKYQKQLKQVNLSDSSVPKLSKAESTPEEKINLPPTNPKPSNADLKNLQQESSETLTKVHNKPCLQLGSDITDNKCGVFVKCTKLQDYRQSPENPSKSDDHNSMTFRKHDFDETNITLESEDHKGSHTKPKKRERELLPARSHEIKKPLQKKRCTHKMKKYFCKKYIPPMRAPRDALNEPMEYCLSILDKPVGDEIKVVSQEILQMEKTGKKVKYPFSEGKKSDPLAKYRHLKITHVEVKRPPQSKEKYLPAVKKDKGKELSEEEAKAIIKFRYELLRHLNEEFKQIQNHPSQPKPPADPIPHKFDTPPVQSDKPVAKIIEPVTKAGSKKRATDTSSSDIKEGMNSTNVLFRVKPTSRGNLNKANDGVGKVMVKSEKKGGGAKEIGKGHGRKKIEGGSNVGDDKNGAGGSRKYSTTADMYVDHDNSDGNECSTTDQHIDLSKTPPYMDDDIDLCKTPPYMDEEGKEEYKEEFDITEAVPQAFAPASEQLEKEHQDNLYFRYHQTSWFDLHEYLYQNGIFSFMKAAAEEKETQKPSDKDDRK